MGTSFDPQQAAEFDQYAGGYDQMHRDSIRASGEDPDYFAIYKQRVLERLLGRGFGQRVLDFGCGIGNLTRFLIDSFPAVDGFDPSAESARVAAERAPRARFYNSTDAIPRETYGAVVVANVLHHVPPAERPALLSTIHELLAPGGRLVIFEHNPLNPVTRRAVNACPFDDNAVLLYPWEVTRLLRETSLTEVDLEYIVFFPRALAPMRPLEPKLGWLPMGAQVCGWGVKR